MGDWRRDRVGSALRGENPTVLARLSASFAVIGDVQWLPGYCLLLTDDPSADRLTALPKAQRHLFLDDLDSLAEAVERACSQLDERFRRVNIEILGNANAFLHAHVWPRYDWEPSELVHYPVWLYPRERWSDPATALGQKHDRMRETIKKELAELTRLR